MTMRLGKWRVAPIISDGEGAATRRVMQIWPGFGRNYQPVQESVMTICWMIAFLEIECERGLTWNNFNDTHRQHITTTTTTLISIGITSSESVLFAQRHQNGNCFLNTFHKSVRPPNIITPLCIDQVMHCIIMSTFMEKIGCKFFFCQAFLVNKSMLVCGLDGRSVESYGPFIIIL